jgi:hypothetical protein
VKVWNPSSGPDLDEYNEMPVKSIAEVFSPSIEKLRSLEWVPWKGFFMMIEVDISGTEIPEEGGTGVRQMYNRVNEFFAVRQIFRRHGWPDKFDREAFRVDKEHLENRFTEIEHSQDKSGGRENGKEQRELDAMASYQELAGEDALLPPILTHSKAENDKKD